MTLDTTEPEVVTVEEAAHILRIGRNTAYGLARQWLATDGREGLPVLVLGRTLRVSVSVLREMLDHPRPPNHSERDRGSS